MVSCMQREDTYSWFRKKEDNLLFIAIAVAIALAMFVWEKWRLGNSIIQAPCKYAKEKQIISSNSMGCIKKRRKDACTLL